ncbi:MAG TPA: NADH-ubiquinone oxidoreductase-F iron-sulfur binding region domain-containing protein [Streptosporangiaceae bacterium]|jgi:NADH:ubiquinone oxidoreductase subunit F (NADH-binding)/ferredoxin
MTATTDVEIPQGASLGPPRLTRGLDRLARINRQGHRRIHGRSPYLSLSQVLAIAEAVDLRGRGGAAFPFARKMRAVVKAAESRNARTVVLVNATEGEPASFKDKMLVARTPHLVLDGAMIAATALRAQEVIFGVIQGGPAEQSLKDAVEELDVRGNIRIVRLPEGFVTGEGGALVRGVNGEIPIPPGRKVRAADSGVDGLPTLLSNAETYAQLAILARLGPRRYRELGTEKEPGTTMLTIGGSIVVEVPVGVPLAEVLKRCGIGIGQGVLMGGYHGAWLSPEKAAIATVSREGMSKVGATLGAGIVVPLPADTCPIGEVAAVAAYMGEESAGQCGPCYLGLPAIARSVAELAEGRAGDETLMAIRRGSQRVKGRGACHHPDGTTRFIESAIEAFTADVNAHLDNGTCGRPVKGVLPLPGRKTQVQLTVDWSRCDGHGVCALVVPDLLRLGADGFPVISNTPVPDWLEEDARHAVAMCPALALRLSA